MTDDQIKHMVNRFLSWKLPENFNPDNGISAQRPNYGSDVVWSPSGTNLLDYTQAEAMVRHMLDGLENPPLATPAQDEVERFSEAVRAWHNQHGIGTWSLPMRGSIEAGIAALSTPPPAATPQPAGEVAQEQGGEGAAIIAWLRILGNATLTPSIVAFFGDQWGSEGQRLLLELADAIERGDHRLGLPAAQEGEG